MAKSKDYIFEEVQDAGGQRIGYVKDLIVDFGQSKVIGFEITPYKFIKKPVYVVMEDVIYSNNSIIVGNTVEGEFLSLARIMDMHVVDSKFNVIGLVSEIIFDSETFAIKAVYIKDSSIFSVFKSRRVILLRDLIVGEDYILYTGRCTKLQMMCLPAFEGGSREDLYYEKDSI